MDGFTHRIQKQEMFFQVTDLFCSFMFDERKILFMVMNYLLVNNWVIHKLHLAVMFADQ